MIDPVTHAVIPWTGETWASMDGKLTAKPGTVCAYYGGHLFVGGVCSDCGLDYWHVDGRPVRKLLDRMTR